ncbi:MAG TPA: ECF transporter S component [Erysipelothrix sp.]|nr:ECF transporter S component [Erysipelothrix sp.]
MSNHSTKKAVLSTKQLVTMTIMASLAAVFMFFRFSLPFAPSFMDVDLADVPVLIGGFAYGPLAGVMIAFLKNLIKLITQGTGTSFVGELSNFIVTSAFVSVAAWYYRSHKDLKGSRIALILGVLSLTAVATLSNAFLIFPLFEKVAGFPMEAILNATRAVNPLVHTYWDMMIFAVVPFNLVKGVLNAVVTALLYKHISRFLK